MRIHSSAAALLGGCLCILDFGCNSGGSGSSKPAPKPIPGQVTLRVYLILSADTLHDTVGNPTNQGCRLTKDEIKSYIQALQKNAPKVFGANSKWLWGGFSGANWNDGNRRIQRTGAFSGYTFETGDKVTLTAGTGITPGEYTITAASANELTLSSDINGSGGSIADSSIAGTLEAVQVVRTNAIPETRAGPDRRTNAGAALGDIIVLQGRFDPNSINIYFGGWLTPQPDNTIQVEGGTIDPLDASQSDAVPHTYINDRGWNSGSNKLVNLPDHLLEHEVGHYLLRRKNDPNYSGFPPGGEHTPEGSSHLMDETSPHDLVLPSAEQGEVSQRVMNGTYNQP